MDQIALPRPVYYCGGAFFFRHANGRCQRLGTDPAVARARAGEILAALPADPDAVDDSPVVHRVVPAVSCGPLKVRGPASVFDLADRPLPAVLRAATAPAPQPRLFRAAVGAGGVVRVEGTQYPGNRWTPERQEQEVIRRAKQRPLKPTWGAKRFRLAGSISRE